LGVGGEGRLAAGQKKDEEEKGRVFSKEASRKRKGQSRKKNWGEAQIPLGERRGPVVGRKKSSLGRKG